MHGDAGDDLTLAVVESAMPGENLAHHGNDVVRLERRAQRARSISSSRTCFERARLGIKKSPGAFRRRGCALNATLRKSRGKSELQLSVFVQHRTAFAADAPAMGGKGRAALKKIAPTHAGRMIAKPRGGRPAGRKLGNIDRIRGGGGKPEKQARG